MDSSSCLSSSCYLTSRSNVFGVCQSIFSAAALSTRPGRASRKARHCSKSFRGILAKAKSSADDMIFSYGLWLVPCQPTGMALGSRRQTVSADVMNLEASRKQDERSSEAGSVLGLRRVRTLKEKGRKKRQRRKVRALVQ